MLASALIGTVTLAACGDESDTRQFAGGPQTSLPQGSPHATGDAAVSGSPTAGATQLPIDELLAPRGDIQTALISYRHRLDAVDLITGNATNLWFDPKRRLWAAALAPDGQRVAVLSGPAGATAGWTVDFVAIDAEPLAHIALGSHRGTPERQPDAVTQGEGGIAWIGQTDSVAVSVPSGGITQVFTDGSKVRILSASAAKRPAAVAITTDAGRIAYVNQPSGSEGSGIYAGSMRAKPIDPIVVLPADRSGNRYAHDLAWIGESRQVVTVIEREELGNPQGDLFYIDTETSRPTLAWTSPTGREVWSVDSFAVSEDGVVVAFLTNPSNPEALKPSSVWLMQVEGSALERFELPYQLEDSRLIFSPEGVAVSGVIRSMEGGIGLGATAIVTSTGEVVERYIEALPATPVASPIASPAGSPVASPVASPKPNGSPTAVTTS